MSIWLCRMLSVVILRLRLRILTTFAVHLMRIVCLVFYHGETRTGVSHRALAVLLRNGVDHWHVRIEVLLVLEVGVVLIRISNINCCWHCSYTRLNFLRVWLDERSFYLIRELERLEHGLGVTETHPVVLTMSRFLQRNRQV